MALKNIITGNENDAFYRYKMPTMMTKVEGRGNGIKTNVVNMVDIAKALARPAAYITKYFGCELGAQSKFDEKTGTSHVNGSHDTANLAGLLGNFIKKYVQCYGCGNPETEIIITKTQMLTMKCAACGFLSDVDMRDKLTTFILKNPPEQKKGSKDKKAMRRAEKERLKEGEAADEEQKKIKKDTVKRKGSSKDVSTKTISKKKASHSDEDHSPAGSQAEESEKSAAVVSDDYEDDGIQWQTDTSAEAARQRIQEQLSAVTAGMVMLSTNQEKPDATKSKANGHGNGNKCDENSYEKLVGEIKKGLNKGPTPSDLKPFLGSLFGAPQEIMNAFFEALFSDAGKGFSKEVAKKKKYIAAVTEEEGSQLDLLNAIETFSVKANPEAVKEVSLVFKALYDSDLLEEEIIVDWFNKGLVGSNKGLPIWKNVKPFVEWLQSAESESEEE